MLSKEMSRMLGIQLNRELFSAYLYLDFANYYAQEGLDGFANWFYVQMQEERDHALLVRAYLLNNDGHIVLNPVEAPGRVYDNFASPLKNALEHERIVTDAIHKIYAAAHGENDFRTMQFLDWFVKEQGEEEKNIGDLVKRYELFGEDARGLYLLDSSLAARVYSPPSLALN